MNTYSRKCNSFEILAICNFFYQLFYTNTIFQVFNFSCNSGKIYDIFLSIDGIVVVFAFIKNLCRKDMDSSIFIYYFGSYHMSSRATIQIKSIQPLISLSLNDRFVQFYHILGCTIIISVQFYCI